LTDREGRIDLRKSQIEGTVSATLAPSDDAVVVTFSAECAERYPSIHYLAPGNPLLGQLVALLRDESETSTRLDRLAEHRETSSEIPVVCCRGRDGTLATLSKDASIDESQQAQLLSTWLNNFLENREKASS